MTLSRCNEKNLHYECYLFQVNKVELLFRCHCFGYILMIFKRSELR